MIEALVDNELVFDLGNTVFPEIGPIIRQSDVVITDYSSLFLDAVYASKPVICFAYDLDHYRDNQDGLLYDLDIVFPGPIVNSFQLLMDAVEHELTYHQQVSSIKYQYIKRLFFEYKDDKNAERIVSLIKKV